MEDIPILKVNNAEVIKKQKEKLDKLKKERDEKKVQAALDRITKAAEKVREGVYEKDYNLLALCVHAAESLATVGEMSLAMEKVFGRYKAEVQTISGVYLREYRDVGDEKEMETFRKENQKKLALIKEKVDLFIKEDGRRPRLLLAKMGQDGHDRGQKVVASSFADLGFDVDIGPLFQSAEDVARMALENHVHVVGLSSLAAGHLTFTPSLRDALKKVDLEEVLIIVGGVVPPQDYPELKANGASLIFGPGTVLTDAAIELLDLLLKRIKK